MPDPSRVGETRPVAAHVLVMTVTAHLREPAGTPQGGRFATLVHPEADVALSRPMPAGQNPVAEARNRAWGIAAQLHAAHPKDSLGRALKRLRALADDESAGPEQRGATEVQLITAEYLVLVLDDQSSRSRMAQEIEETAPAMLLGVDINHYAGSSDADRPGECGYDGYDWDAIAADLSGRWDGRGERIAQSVVSRLEQTCSAA